MMQKDNSSQINSQFDEHANHFTLYCFKITIALMLSAWVLTLLHIFIVNTDLMTAGLLSASAILLFPIILCHFIGISASWIKYFLLGCVICSVTVLGSFLTYHTILLSVLPLILSIQYPDRKVIFYTYILSVISISISVMLGYFFGLCDANMVFLTVESLAHYVSEDGTALNFIFQNHNPWITLPLYYIFPRCLMLFLFIPVIINVSKNSARTAVNAANMKRLSELDQMTDLYNKNKFLDMSRTVYPSMDHISAVFFDINNLKETNDSLGHEHGDYLISQTAYLIKRLTSPSCKGYRVGGDEFILILENPSEEQLDSLLKEWQRLLDAHNAMSGTKLFIAVGFASGTGENFKQIIEEADQNMYKNKRELKETAEH